MIFYAFISSTYGLSHDIILSGDQFTEFENSFTYFKRHFFSYIFFSLLIFWIPIAIELDFHFRNFLEIIPNLQSESNELLIDAFSLYLVQYLFFVLLNLTLPSLTDQGKVLRALNENFSILLRNPIRILTSWLIFFVLFSLPSYIVLIICIFIIKVLLGPLFQIMGIIIVAILLSSIILGYPIMSLIATRIYATTRKITSE